MRETAVISWQLHVLLIPQPTSYGKKGVEMVVIPTVVSWTSQQGPTWHTIPQYATVGLVMPKPSKRAIYRIAKDAFLDSDKTEIISGPHRGRMEVA